MQAVLADAPGHGITLAQAFRVWLRIAVLSVGGPAGQIAVMHRILDPWALALSVAALAAVFYLKLGMIPTLLGCSVAGVALHLAAAR